MHELKIETPRFKNRSTKKTVKSNNVFGFRKSTENDEINDWVL